MKFIFETEHGYCREHGKTISDIMEKMYVIQDNLEFLTETLVKQYPSEKSKVSKGYLYSQILCDLDNASDEFYIGKAGSNPQEDIYLEVTTKEIAEENDREFLRGTPV